MKGKVIGSIIVLLLLLAACAPSSTTTAPQPATTGPTAASTTTAPLTTAKPAEKPQYGGTLNLVMLLDISSWDQGLTGC